MGDILHDAAFTTLEITEQLVFNNKIMIDKEFNLTVNKVFANEVITKSFSFPDGTVYSSNIGSRNFTDSQTDSTQHDSYFSGYISVMEGTDNTSNENSVSVGGFMNEALGEYATCVGGRFNESTGINSVTIGGSDNQSTGHNTVSCGQNAIAMHDNTYVWNDSDTTCRSTMPHQYVVGCTNGLFFKLPSTTNIPDHLMPDGYGVWCWEENSHQVCMKTKRNNKSYITYLPTSLHEIGVDIRVDQNGDISTVNLLNPDLK